MKPQPILAWDVCVTKWVRLHGFSFAVVGFSGNTWPGGSSLPVERRGPGNPSLQGGAGRGGPECSPGWPGAQVPAWPLLDSMERLTLCAQLLRWRRDSGLAPQWGWKPQDRTVALLMPTMETGIAGVRSHRQNRTSQAYQELNPIWPRIFVVAVVLALFLLLVSFYFKTSLGGELALKLEPSVFLYVQFSSVQFSRSVVSNSLRPHERQQARPPCLSPTPGVYPNPFLYVYLSKCNLFLILCMSFYYLIQFSAHPCVIIFKPGGRKKKNPQLLKRGPWFKRCPHDGSPEWTASPRLVLKLCHRKDSRLPGDAPLCSDQPHEGRVRRRPRPWAFASFCPKTHTLLSCVSRADQGRRAARTDLREGPSKPCHKRTVFSPIYFSLRETFFCQNRKHEKSAGVLLFWRLWTARCFPWDSISKSTHGRRPNRKDGVSCVTVCPRPGSLGPHHPRLCTGPLACRPRWQARKGERSRCLCSWLPYCCRARKIVFPRASCSFGF